MYNRSDTPKIVRDFKLIFIKDNRIVYSLVPDYEVTRRVSSPMHHVDKMEVSNIMPKMIQILVQSGQVSEEDFDKVEGSNKIELL